ncbi:PEP/pyruvate-binding domain-containing protein [Streptomyces sediminimaris]|uniref:PEP/pyruvate-binding domain-containing protein n=1 Tax=Streptomyces sediminimaris TaxID=3383721 RepID=UPI0039997EB6
MSGPALRNPELVGRKAASQVELALAGIAVPPLVCVPASVFDHVVAADPTLGRLLHDPADDPLARAAQLRERLAHTALPTPLTTALDGRFAELAGSAGLVAVRSCVVPNRGRGDGEDSAADPFAGLGDSFLYVGRDDIARRVAQCWASAFNAEAVAYRIRRGLDPFAARVAVTVQRMAMGARSFVAFTRDPRDGARRTVVAAAHGIGEGVVQEKADVDHYFHDPATDAVGSELTLKRRAVGWDPGRPDAGPVPLTLTPRQATESVLTDDEVRRIAALAAAAEQHLGAPQDVEGTITADGEIVLVQSRPVQIARPGGPAPGASPDQDTALWDNNNVTESFPGISSALTYSAARQLYETGFRDLYRRMGVPARTLRRNAHLLARMIGHLDGRIYYRLDCWYRLHGLMRCFRPLWPTWERSLGLAATEHTRPRPAPVTRALDVAGILRRLTAHPLRVRGFLRWWDACHAELADTGTRSPAQLADTYRLLWAQVGRRWGVTLVNGVFLFAATAATTHLASRWLKGDTAAVTAGMLCGGRDNRSTQAVLAAVALAERAVEDPSLAAELRDADADAAWRRIAAGPHGPAFTHYLRAFGDRTLHDLKLETRTPRQEPPLLLTTLRTYVDRRLRVAQIRATARRTRDDAVRTLRAHCRNPVKRAVLAAGYAAMRALLKVREDTRFCRSQLFGDSRALLLRLGEHAAAAGCLERAEDVLDLTVEEVLGAIDGTLPGADLRALVAVRAAERARCGALAPLPARLRTPADLPLPAALAQVPRTAEAARAAPPGVAGDALRGLASSPGTVRGRAAVVLDPVGADIPAGQVLIARETDPGWLFLMMSAAALVVERGTLLSHTAITGRLLGIPTVVAVPGATRRIADGALVEVDGAAGTVRLLERP